MKDVLKTIGSMYALVGILYWPIILMSLIGWSIGWANEGFKWFIWNFSPPYVINIVVLVAIGTTFNMLVWLKKLYN